MQHRPIDNASSLGGKRFLFNPREPSFRDDPYPHYRRLRDEDPVHFSFMGVWFLGLYEDVATVLRDKRFAAQDIPSQVQRKNELLQSRKISERQPPDLDALVASTRNWFVFKDPPEHTRLRRLVSKAFTPKAVEDMRPYIRDYAQRLLERVRPRGEMDLVKEFAAHVPVNVIATMFGIPEHDFPRVAAWAERLPRIFDPLVSLEELETLDRAAREFSAYLRALIPQRRAEPTSDLLSALIAVKDERDELTEDEIISVCVLTFSAGEESTVAMLGNGALALLKHPDRLEHLRAHPELMPAAVEELMRYDGPLQMTCRTALEDVELRGKHIRKGQAVYVAFGSANRDPRQFQDPDTLVFTRPRQHLAFGEGHHFCVGAALARVELQEAFPVLLEMTRGLKVAGEPRWREHLVIRGLTSLPVTFDAGG